ncbi:DUF397 domain-containing protein [Nocardia sp. NBC_00565]|nr:DUF397 domain-containing protein [Nocardia sp. NBC_00565]
MTDKYDVDLSGTQWFKSRPQRHRGTVCGSSASRGRMVGVRDSKNRTGPALVFTPGEWDAFAAGVAAEEFECP